MEVLVGFLQATARKLGIAGELVSFMWSNKRWWLVPMMIMLLAFGVILIWAQSSAVVPFIYTLF
jgi:hypothetical protein